MGGARAGIAVRLRAVGVVTIAVATLMAATTQPAIAKTAPRNTSLPTISGVAMDGRQLSASPGSWWGTGAIRYAYQWLRCDSFGAGCLAIAGATGKTLTLLPADVGSTERVLVTASNSAGSGTASSAQTAVVSAAPPSNASAPTISGTAQVGQTLSGSAGSWTGTPPLSYTDQWRRCDTSGANCTDVSGATASTYTLASSDAGATLRLAVTATNSGGAATAGSAQTAVVSGGSPPPPPPATDPVIAAAGDIACDPGDGLFNGGLGEPGYCRMLATSNLLTNAGLKAVLTLGDDQYECGSLTAFQQSYDLSWGRVKAITFPTPGNHEYYTSGGTGCTSANAGAAGYFDYFGAAAGTRGQGWYSFDVGTWHLIALNSNCSDVGGCSPTSPQGQWLASDLAAHRNTCTLAYWHYPLFASSPYQVAGVKPLWQALYNAGADLILSGHAHIYERFAPQTPDGVYDPSAGIREFIVGTGGEEHQSLGSTAANSQIRDNTTFGVLKLTLHATGYDWSFQPEAGGTLTDSGSGACH